MQQQQIAYLLMVSSNEGQLKPKEVSSDVVKKLIRNGFITSEKIRNSNYYYPTEKGRNVARMFFAMADNIDAIIS